MERYFERELTELNQMLLQMGSRVEHSILRAMESLKNQDRFVAEEVISGDKEIDELELAIDDKCVNLLALFQPEASDLRFITNAAKINAELERIADLAVDVAQRSLELAEWPLLKPLIDIPKLAAVAQRMVKDAIDAFVNRDADKAGSVVLSDFAADQLRDLVQRELIYDYMVKDGSVAPRAVPLLLAARHLERICDHATNIAEDVIYMIEAKVVKHHPEKLSLPPGQVPVQKKKVLFVCIHNSARSQIAEAWLNLLAPDRFEAQSAGLTPGRLNPLAVQVMREAGIDISNNRTKDVMDFYRQGWLFHYVITVCDQASSERCPVFPGVTTRLQWSFGDPSLFEGTPEEKLHKMRQVRDDIRQKIEEFLLHAS